MRKAEKRRRGEERAKVYEEQVRESGLEAQRQANKRRAKRADQKLQDKQRKQARKEMNRMGRLAELRREEDEIIRLRSSLPLDEHIRNGV